MSAQYFNLEEDEAFDSLKNFIKTDSLFDNWKLGVIHRGVMPEKAARKEYVALLKNNLNSKNIILIVLADESPAKDSLFLLKDPVSRQKFQPLTGADFQNFLQKEAAERGLSFDSESKKWLALVYGGNSWGLITELEKLMFLENRKITKNTLESHFDIFLPLDFFAALNWMKTSRVLGDRLSVLEELLARSGDPAMIFNFLSTLVRTAPAKQKMADYDVAIKTGKLGYEEALLDFICSI